MINISKKGNILGIDIGTKRISFAMIKNYGKKSEILHLSSIETPKDAVSNGNIENFLAISEEIRRYLLTLDNKYKAIALTIGSPSVIIRELKIPKVKEKEIENKVLEDISNSYKGITDNYEVTYKITNTDSDNMYGFVAMCPKGIYEEYMKLVQDLDGAVRYIDVSANCVCKALNVYVNLPIREGNIIVVDIGTQKSMVSIVSNDVLVLSRHVPAGGVTLDQFMVREFNMTIEEAERRKKEGYDGMFDEEEMGVVINTSYGSIQQEIQRTISFFNQNMSTKGISKIILTGGGAKVPGIQNHFQTIFKIPTIVLSSGDFSSIKTRQIEDMSLYLPAIGAAIREE
ncbi:type IV pilus assembly protein PilM [Hathewaya proteolytica DSM 3090]|uniref:Type IV pilus assembly protein PilM n=1 Tax=Hathewaya proteolytica DSM 3090 TaxID=1121331 RepID=A0A1M6LHE7_9CLOT|nr:pilus assembly protein PilM [Hathewaya proteolytica]SHJ70624.1 type IV pilus assembly protein PilM [Hathewaya proteolytica DSM 3090]